MKLDWNQIVQCIGETATKLRAHYVYDKINSTNDWQTWSGNASALPAICLAEQQLNGRGRNGKSWISLPHENIYLTLVWSFEGRAETGLTGLSLAVGLSVARLLTDLDINAKVKWPNDVLIGKDKMAGILIETKIKQTGEVIAIIGVGMNYVLSDVSREKIGRGVVDFVSACKNQPVPSRNQLIGNLIRRLIQTCETFDQEGFSAFISAWETYDVCSGKLVNVKDATGEWAAYALGINDQCGLKLLRNNVEHVIYAADVSISIC